MNRQSIQSVKVHALAPEKPELGQSCNGCGLCCAAEPCPVSRLWLGHRVGACPALLWQHDERHYRCGMALAPSDHVRWLPKRWNAVMARVFRRWIAAGSGCDFDAVA